MKYEKESLNRYFGGQMISQSVKIKIVKYEKYLHTENIEMSHHRDGYARGLANKQQNKIQLCNRRLYHTITIIQLSSSVVPAATVERDLESCHPNFFLELFGI
jgi:hypothetical protein